MILPAAPPPRIGINDPIRPVPCKTRAVDMITAAQMIAIPMTIPPALRLFSILLYTLLVGIVFGEWFAAFNQTN
jgi:hypothetical protein